jgi:predicted CoA-substrate-specific enzyme activase
MSNQVYVGIDAGSRATKIVVVDAAGHVLRRGMIDQSVRPAESAKRLFDETLDGLSVVQCVATGYARNFLSFAHRTVTEITCHAKGCVAEFPDVGAIIEIGGQDSKYIYLEHGRVHDFAMNDRCAAGTGRFLEVIAMRLGVSLTDLEEVLRDAPQDVAVAISSMCVVFAETEIIGLLASGSSASVILQGVQAAVAARVVAMMGDRKKISGRIVFTGGVAQVYGMSSTFEKALAHTLVIPKHPQYTGAYGAALLAIETKR